MRIEKLVPGGDGLGHFDGGVVFVPLTAPGDLVSLRNIHKRRGVHFAECDQIIESSSGRRDPPCPWFGECGGCQWMHLDYGSQLRWKEDILRQVLKRIAHFKGQFPIRIHSAPVEFGYRQRARFQINGSNVGFFSRASNAVVTWERCMLLPEPLNLIVTDLRKVFEDRAAPSSLRSCEAALSPVGDGVTLNWQFEKNRGNREAAEKIMDSMQEMTAGRGGELTGQAAQDQRGKVYTARGAALSLKVGRVTMHAFPGTFFQVNPRINTILVDRVLTFLRNAGVSSLLDLYCGNGNFSLPAAAAGISTTGVESSHGAVRDAISVAGSKSRFIEMDVGRFLARDDAETDAVIVDPPRTGLPADVAAMLGVKRPPCLIYVSCEPSTLARDLARLTEAGYAATDMEIFDMFPQTSHFETLAVVKA